jgi:hypothetical protein
MKSLTRTLLGAAAAMALFTAAIGAQSAAVPRTPWGDPDIQGTYTNSNESGIPMERPAEFAGRRLEDVKPEELAALIKQRASRAEQTAEVIGGTQDENTGAGPKHWYENYNASNSRAWMIQDAPDYKMPATTDDAKKRAAAAKAARRGGDGYYTGPFDSPKDLTLYVRCISRGVPGSMMPAIYGNSYRIIQSPGQVAIQYEMIHETRLIPIDSQPRPHLPKSIELDMGDPRGHWEGDTLVVETTNFRTRSIYRNANPETLRFTERFTRTAANKVRWSVTVEDPKTWTKPWTFSLPLTMNDNEPIMLYECHEGNYGLRNILSAARAEERAQ